MYVLFPKRKLFNISCTYPKITLQFIYRIKRFIDTIELMHLKENISILPLILLLFSHPWLHLLAFFPESQHVYL